MGSRYDFPIPEEFAMFMELFNTIHARRNFASQMDEGYLATFVHAYGFDVMRFVIPTCMENDWLKAGQWKRLASLSEQYTIEKVAWAVERMQGRQNYSLDTVEGILRNEIAAYRKPAIDKRQAMNDRPGGTKKPPKYPTAEGLHTHATAASWIIAKGKGGADVTEYFELAGRDQEFGFALLTLKPEYR